MRLIRLCLPNGIDDFKLQNFITNFTLNGLNGARIKKLQKAYNAYMLGSGNRQAMKS